MMMNLLLLGKLSATLSSIGSIIVIISTFFRKDTRTKVRRMFLVLALVDLIYAAVTFLPRSWCATQATLSVASSISSRVIATGIAVYILLAVSGYSLKALRQTRYSIWIVSVVYPAMCVAVIAISNVTFGASAEQVVCSIVDDNKVGSDAMRVLSGFLPDWVSIVVSLVALICARRVARGSADSRSLQFLMAIPCLDALLLLPAAGNRIFQMCCTQTPDQAATPWLAVMQAVCDPAAGLVNGVFYLLLSVSAIRTRPTCPVPCLLIPGWCGWCLDPGNDSYLVDPVNHSGFESNWAEDGQDDEFYNPFPGGHDPDAIGYLSSAYDSDSQAGFKDSRSIDPVTFSQSRIAFVLPSTRNSLQEL